MSYINESTVSFLKRKAEDVFYEYKIQLVDNSAHTLSKSATEQYSLSEPKADIRYEDSASFNVSSWFCECHRYG